MLVGAPGTRGCRLPAGRLHWRRDGEGWRGASVTIFSERSTSRPGGTSASADDAMTPVRRRAVVVAAALAGTAVLSVLALPRGDEFAGMPASTFDRLFPASFGSWRVDP